MTLWQKTKLLLSLRSAWNQAEKELNDKPHTPMKLKPGITTTEFWTTIGLGLGGLTLSALGMVDGTYAVAAATILGAVYTAARGLVKSKAQ
jgi:hypothetical protein